MDAQKIVAIRKRVDAVNADLPTVTDLDLVAYVASIDAEMLLDELAATQGRVRELEAGLRKYADPESWDPTMIDISGWLFECEDDEPWEIARAALAGE